MDYEDQRNRCCCNIHVLVSEKSKKLIKFQKGANIIAYVGIGLSIFSIAVAIFIARYYVIIGCVAFILLYASIIYALNVRKYSYYWLYLIINVT